VWWAAAGRARVMTPRGCGAIRVVVPRPKATRPTDAEMEILRVLWSTGGSTIGGVQKQLRATEQRDVSPSTVQKALEIMVAKGLVTKKCDDRPCVYSAAVRRDAVERMFVRHIERILGRSLASLVMRSVPRKKATKEDVDQLKRYLEGLPDSEDNPPAGPSSQKV
jgi:BlaI family transcriptional regulator, penicillinase repressor